MLCSDVPLLLEIHCVQRPEQRLSPEAGSRPSEAEPAGDLWRDGIWKELHGDGVYCGIRRKNTVNVCLLLTLQVICLVIFSLLVL